MRFSSRPARAVGLDPAQLDPGVGGPSPTAPGLRRLPTSTLRPPPRAALRFLVTIGLSIAFAHAAGAGGADGEDGDADGIPDLIDNCPDICKHDPRFGRVFLLSALALVPLSLAQAQAPGDAVEVTAGTLNVRAAVWGSSMAAW